MDGLFGFLKSLAKYTFFVVIGFISVYYLMKFIDDGKSPLLLSAYGTLLILALIIAVLVHELGHLCFGLITGFKFSSFRILNVLIVKTDKRVKISITPTQ